MQNQIIPLGVTEQNGKIVVSSRDVAKVFEKEHKNVLRDIRGIAIEEDFNQRNFEPVEYIDNKGEKRPEFLMNRDGFTLLAMGFNGEKAMQFKRAYIKAFNEMEAKLTFPKIPKTLAEALRLAADLEEKRAALTSENETLEIALNQSLKFYTVAKYNKVYNQNWNMSECQLVGKKLTAYCRANSVKICKCKTNDERFGEVNSYPLTAFESVLQKQFDYK